MTGLSQPLGDASAVKLALMAKQARAQVGAIARAEPVAIIGIGCRFPGGITSPESYWSVLRDGVDAVGPIPRDRWDVEGLHDPDPAMPGKISASQGGFLDDVALFDAEFFDILRREAERMDPQQRIFLEVAIEALDRAGQTREQLAGSRTGVFIASYYNDYTLLQLADREWIDARTLTGTQHSVLANRLSHYLDLRGPSVSIDTACSSSLVAVHLACQSLRTGDSDMALAGGVSLILAPEMMMALSKVGFMSPTGRCRTFDAQADGFVRGEGCGVVVLKRLSDALADRDAVLAVIRGSAVNQDGRSTVLSAPSGLAQEQLVRDSLAHAQLTADRVGFVETHGTATPLGDPIEVEALAHTIGAPRADGSTCYLGSAKANLGHLEAASGVAGLIKATLALRHGEIPRQLHFTALNRHLSLAGTCLAVADQHLRWPAGARPRVAGVSGFGVGGTNAHVLVEEAPLLPGDERRWADEEPQLVTLSARTAPALRALADRWVEWLPQAGAPLAAIAATTAARRTHHHHRLALVARSKAEVVTRLRAFRDAGVAPGLATGTRVAGRGPHVTFVFGGQGTQWAGMGTALAARYPVFLRALRDVDVRVQEVAGWSVRAVLEATSDHSRLDDTEFAQPAIAAMQIALAALWQSWGVRPAAVIGHSVGEIAALYVAGILSLDDAVRIVTARGRIMRRAGGGGRMEAASLSVREAEGMLEEVGPGLSIAAVNGPRSVVFAGTPGAIHLAVALLDGRGIAHGSLPVSYAFHSALMAPCEHELAAAIGPLTIRPSHVEVYSTVRGGAIEHTEIDAAYFGTNVCRPVLFAEAVGAALAARSDAFLEIGPHPVLGGAIRETAVACDAQVPVFASMRRDGATWEPLAQACAGLYALGQTISFDAMHGAKVTPVDVPAYPWQRERFWLRDDRPVAVMDRGRHAGATVLGVRRREGAAGTVDFDARWPSPDLEWLRDHQIGSHTRAPAAALLDTLHAAADQAHGHGTFSLLDVVIHQALVLDEPTAWTTTATIGSSGSVVELRAQRAGVEHESSLIASATVGASVPQADGPRQDAPGGAWVTDAAPWYERLETLGSRLGSRFRTIERWRAHDGCAEGWLSSPLDLASDAHRAALLDGALQICVAAAAGGLPEVTWLPIAVDRVTRYATLPRRVRVVADAVTHREGGTLTASVRVYADTGAVLAELEGVHFARADSVTRPDIGPYEIAWQVDAVPPGQAVAVDASGAWIVLGGDDGPGVATVAALRSAGGRCLTLRFGDRTERHDETSWTIASGDEEGLRTCLGEVPWRAGLPLRGVVHLWSTGPRTLQRGSGPGDWRVTGSALVVLQALDPRTDGAAPVWLVSHGAQPANGVVTDPQGAGLWGLANVASSEYADRLCHAVDLDPLAADTSLLVRELATTHIEARRVAFRGPDCYVPSLVRVPSERSPAIAVPPVARLALTGTRTLDALAWEPCTSVPPRPGHVRVHVLAAGLNFRDVLMALGMYPSRETMFGAECAGLVDAVGEGVTTLRVGDLVFGFAPGSLATESDVPARFLAKVPSVVSVEQAAALPVAFLTTMYGLEGIAGIERGTRVLIHAGAGGVGLAAMQIAQRCGAAVFATAGTPAKRARLLGRGATAVFDSRSTAFAEELLRATDGSGVDVVLNSLTGDLIPASLRVLAAGGWFLELGKREIWTPEQLAAVRPDVRYRAYDLADVAAADPDVIARMLHELVERVVAGTLQPLPVRPFPFSGVAEAFRCMSQARHVGKLVLRAPRRVDADARHPLVRSGATYVVTGGTGSLGVRTACWLVERGARHLVLTGRHSPPAEADTWLDQCRARGAQVEVRRVDAGDEAAMAALLDELARTMPPLRGIVHAAGIIDEGVLAQQTWSRWMPVLQGKACGARVVAALADSLDLDFFVLYSSASTWLGPVGQGAYVAANAELDAIAWARRSHGRPALSVGWGQWRDAGMAARMAAAGHEPWSGRGLGWLEAPEAFSCLEGLLRSGATQALVSPTDWRRFLSRLPDGVTPAFFSAVAPVSRVPATSRLRPPPVTDTDEVARRWEAAPRHERRALMVAFVAACARQVIGLDDRVRIDAQTALKDVGLDSLMAIELRSVLTRALRTSLPATLLFDYPTIDAVVAFLERTLQLGSPATPHEGILDRDIAALSDAEAEALLLAELAEDAERPR